MIASDDRRYRITLEPGEVALVSDQGDKIHIKQGHTIEIFTENGTVKVNAGTVILGGNTALPTAGIVTGECVCAYTGAPHADYSSKVKAVK
jgi:phage gp45-like